jgi:hypothetical protein
MTIKFTHSIVSTQEIYSKINSIDSNFNNKRQVNISDSVSLLLTKDNIKPSVIYSEGFGGCTGIFSCDEYQDKIFLRLAHCNPFQVNNENFNKESGAGKFTCMISKDAPVVVFALKNGEEFTERCKLSNNNIAEALKYKNNDIHYVGYEGNATIAAIYNPNAKEVNVYTTP